MFKRIGIVLLAIGLLLSMTGCQEETADPETEKLVQAELDYIEKNYDTDYAAAIGHNDHSEDYYTEVVRDLHDLELEFTDPTQLTPEQTEWLFFMIETSFEPERRAKWYRLREDGEFIFTRKYVRDILKTYLDHDMSEQIRGLASYREGQDALVYSGDTFATFGGLSEKLDKFSLSRNGSTVTIQAHCLEPAQEAADRYTLSRIITVELHEKGQRFVIRSIQYTPV